MDDPDGSRILSPLPSSHEEQEERLGGTQTSREPEGIEPSINLVRIQVGDPGA